MRFPALRFLSRKSAALAAVVVATSLVLLGHASKAAADPPSASAEPAAASADNHYIGANGCRSCHRSTAAGDQYGKWESIKHSDAFATLGTELGKELAKKAGVEDPQKDAKCLRCHVTASGEPAEKFASTYDPEMGVQCESCHGAGENHRKARFAAAAGAKPGERMTVGADEINSRPSPQGCLNCHNKDSPSYKPFCFAKYQAKIRHLDPRKTRPAEEQAQIDQSCCCGDNCTCDGVTSFGCGKDKDAGKDGGKDGGK
jgi:hypothetical protein